MFPLLKSTVELRKTTHCVIARDTNASYSTEGELAPLEAVILALCNGNRDTASIAALIPTIFAKSLSYSIEEYVSNTLEQRKGLLDFIQIPVPITQRYNPSDFLFFPQNSLLSKDIPHRLMQYCF